jgi:hypothetical protein
MALLHIWVARRAARSVNFGATLLLVDVVREDESKVSQATVSDPI